MKQKQLGFVQVRNSWQGQLVVPYDEWKAKGREFAHERVEGWDLGRPKTDGKRVIVPLGLHRDREKAVVDPGVLSYLRRLWPFGNLVPANGVSVGLRLLFPGIGTAPAGCTTMGVDNGTVNPNANFVSSTNGDGSTGSSTLRRIVSFSVLPVPLVGLTVSPSGIFNQANVNFAIRRLFLSNAAAGTTDANGNLIAMTNVFTLDYTIFSVWQETFTANYVGVGS